MSTASSSGTDRPLSMGGRDPAEQGWWRLFYRGWRPTHLGRIINRLAAWWSSTGRSATFQQTLEVPGRTSGKLRSTPVAIAAVDGRRYLVSILGAESEWVKNVVAADGLAVLRHGGRERVRLVAVPPEERPPVLREYVRVAQSGRRHFPLEPDAPVSDFAAIAARYPVFRICPA
jgi:deazaflavin-dependent oxidoreductase (nitroreductase family)